MADAAAHDVTQVLNRVAAGDERAAARLLPMVYDELRKLARHRMAKTPPGNTLDPTALVHEAYLRVAGNADDGWAGRRHFFFAAARAMRDILVEQVRRKAALKYGGGRRRVGLTGVDPVFELPTDDVLALYAALERFEKEDPDCAKTVMLRYFTGLTIEEVAEVQQLSPSTVKRHWRFARAWLHRVLSTDDTATGGASRDG